MIAEEGDKTGNIPPPNFRLIAERHVIFPRHPSITKAICGIRNVSSVSSFNKENFAESLSYIKLASDRNLNSVINLQLNLPVLIEESRNPYL
jgi:hypothetical protein